MPSRPARVLARADALANRLYGWRFNPLYQSGAIVVALLVVLLVTGVWLLLFYRVGSPWASVAGITANPWTGNWVRGLHRYASDAAVVAVLVHLLRMLVQHRTWGPRTLAWASGLVLLGVLLVSGWTGFVMVWDTFGEALAREGARWLDALPILSEPVQRTFAGPARPPGAFFFINLFLHVALPLGMGLLLWLHVSRVARPTLMPPRGLTWGLVGVLTLVAVVWPLEMAPEADPLVRPESIPMDWWYGFWLPLTTRVPASVVWLAGGAAALGLLLMPRWTRSRRAGAPPSEVDPALCTGCTQCSLDCPFEAISMVTRTDGRADLLAHVTTDRCVSCGICAGSCAPMGIGPPGRTGRDQLDQVRTWLRSARTGAMPTVIVCRHGAAAVSGDLAAAGGAPYVVDCVGNLHSSVVEFLIRGGVPGVLVLGCPPRDCRGREGPRWLGERLYHDREAELKARVDRRRLGVGYAAAGERREALAALAAFRHELEALEPPSAEPDPDVEAPCEPVALEEPA